MAAKKEKKIRRTYKKAVKGFAESNLFNKAKEINRKVWFMFIGSAAANALLLVALAFFIIRGL